MEGFAAWLVCGFIEDEFHLHELFSYSKAKWVRLVKEFKKRGEKNEKFAKAFADWRKVEFEHRTLRDCMVKAGLAEATADRQMKRVRELGFQVSCPPCIGAAVTAYG